MSDRIDNQSEAQLDAHKAIVDLYNQCFDDQKKNARAMLTRSGLSWMEF